MTSSTKISRLVLFPPGTEINKKDHLVIGGCDTIELVNEFGTPLYIFDEASLRGKCAEFKSEFGKRYSTVTVIYAAKAFLNKALAQLLKEEDIGLDVVSMGEASIARSIDFPMEKAYFHGNNKSPQELKLALEWRIGRIVVDNFYEMKLLNSLAGQMNRKTDILLRLSPGIDPHTHKYLATGVIDSKFGFPLAYSAEAVAKALSYPNLNLIGLHCHIGSSLYETGPYVDALDNMLKFAADVKTKCGFEMEEFNIGGGFAVQYEVTKPAPPISVYADVITTRVTNMCRELNLKLPRLIIEPGRSMVAQSGVALYTIGAIKEIPGIRIYATVDGGMADNIRPAIYGSKYEALLANKVSQPETDKYTIAGKFCESGDILIHDINLPQLVAGDILAIPVCGAYCIPMSSNYNASLKPAIVMAGGGKAHLIRRRETFTDLVERDLS